MVHVLVAAVDVKGPVQLPAHMVARDLAAVAAVSTKYEQGRTYLVRLCFISQKSAWKKNIFK